MLNYSTVILTLISRKANSQPKQITASDLDEIGFL